MEKLEKFGEEVHYNDPYVPTIPPSREHAHFPGRKSVDVAPDYDLILVATHHSDYKQGDFSGSDVPLVDTRNCIAYKPRKYYRA
jgi:UDP-N-acetyl-D-glucosamine dehydrogenase